MVQRRRGRIRRNLCAPVVCGALALGALILGAAPSTALADHFVTVDYSGTLDETFVYQPSDPSVWQESMHYAWQERMTARVGSSPAIVTVLSRRLSITGVFNSTMAPPHQASNCSGDFSPRADVIERGFFPLHIAEAGGQLNIVASDGTNTNVAQSSGTGDCANALGTSGSTPTHHSVAAANPVFLIPFSRRSYTRTFNLSDRNPDGSAQVSVNATFRAAIAGNRPPPLPLGPPVFTPARAQAKRNALNAMRATVTQALYPCAVGLTGAALFAAGPAGAAAGLVLVGTAGPLCKAMYETLIAAAKTYNDPPRSDYFVVARVGAARGHAAQGAACARFSGSTRAFCLQIAAAAANVLGAFKQSQAIAAAIEATVSRDTAAAGAHNQAAVSLQEQTLANLGPQFSAALKAQSAAGAALQSVLRSDGVSLRVSVAQFKRDAAELLRKLARGGINAARFETLARSALRPRRFDPIVALQG